MNNQELNVERTKLLNSKCETIEEFEALQDKLNEIELKINMEVL